MAIVENLKRSFERLTGSGRPGARDLSALVHRREPQLFHFKDDGETPNNPRLPLVHYRAPLSLAEEYDPAALFEELFAAHGWADGWRNGVYDFLHFHSHSHEVLGIARGHVGVEFGGANGRVIELKAGDVVVLPAGTGHRRRSASHDLLVVGAYPARGGSRYDQPKPSEIDHDKAVAAIAKVRLPAKDPVYGRDGPLIEAWRKEP